MLEYSVERLGDFDELQEVLESQDAQMGVSEIHGLAAGMLCVQLNADFNKWLAALFDTEEQFNGLTKDDMQSLAGLFNGTLELLKSDQFIFDLLLPHDDERIAVRANALSEWCQGFLYGVAYMGVGDDKDWTDESRGVLRDLMEISRLDSDNSDDTDEQAFIELHEYVRMAVQLLMTELQLVPSDKANEPTVH